MRTLIEELLRKRNDYSNITGGWCCRKMEHKPTHIKSIPNCFWIFTVDTDTADAANDAARTVLFIDVMRADRNECKMIYY